MNTLGHFLKQDWQTRASKAAEFAFNLQELNTLLNFFGGFSRVDSSFSPFEASPCCVLPLRLQTLTVRSETSGEPFPGKEIKHASGKSPKKMKGGRGFVSTRSCWSVWRLPARASRPLSVAPWTPTGGGMKISASTCSSHLEEAGRAQVRAADRRARCCGDI